MRQEETQVSSRSHTYIDTPAPERCSCMPLSSLHPVAWGGQEDLEDSLQVIPVTEELNACIRSTLQDFFPRIAPLSLFLLHIAQLEHLHIAPKSAVLHRRHRFHAPSSFLEQVLLNVRRCIRYSDQMLIHDGAGAAIIFPDVDAEGAFSIQERIYHSINLLQPETFIPQLKRETDILMGMGSYPKPGASLEELLYHTGLIARRLRLRPSVTAQLRGVKPAGIVEELPYNRQFEDDERAPANHARANGIPFMQLPSRLPQRLKQLIPYELALELRCAPVGRDHNRLTVAMAQPSNIHAIARLREVTGMTIFPVSCEINALETLLTNGW
ncbi:MAG TPA: hypothetical protein VKV20_11345 [Ktedonobacteraceae bacterium]|jgi:hypothetical protein|nr:hypothetical protein [Ktedonobacteraceae bacterium]